MALNKPQNVQNSNQNFVVIYITLMIMKPDMFSLHINFKVIFTIFFVLTFCTFIAFLAIIFVHVIS